MSKVRVYQLAKDLGLTNKELISKLEDLAINVSNHMSALEEEEVELIKQLIEEEKQPPVQDNGEDVEEEIEIEKNKNNNSKKPKNKKKNEDKTINKSHENEKELYIEDMPIIEIGERIVVKDFAVAIKKSVNEVISKLIHMGVMATINQEIDFESAEKIANELGIEVIKNEVEAKEEEEVDFIIPIDKEEDLKFRPPVVTVMGHVDHGKTSLLDAIRKTKVTEKEAGGITQHIGASEVEINGKKIVFLDTPGHEAFTAMRARGAKVTDIAILVVAADDGVMPQTIEAINHAKAAEVPIIVAINKMDKEGANPDRVKQELADNGILIEEWGGDVVSVPVSALKGTNIDTLLEMILLVAEMENFRANPNRKAVGTVVEAQLDKGKGSVATVIVQNGTLKIGDSVVIGTSHGRVRAMVNSKGKNLKQAGPSTAVEITGLSDVPLAGDQLIAVADDKKAREIATNRINKIKEQQLKSSQKISLDALFSQVQEGQIKELNVIVKADVQGSVEAVRQSLGKLSNDKVVVKSIHGGVGAITETDVMLASASNAIIIGFNVRPSSGASSLADKEEVDIRLYKIIYNALEDLEAAMKGMLDPEFKEVELGKAQVRATFKLPNGSVIAGCYVTEGKILRNANVRLVRDGIVITDGTISSLKRFKDDAKEVATGYECGIGIYNFNNIKEGDIIEAYKMQEIER
ncbi:translation initiation factor IF-2 [Serpentinicella alkaliphila]|uniref:Translation initiation factor IF-2 n=1 Tax=Serpentinicella alkaliphila TaxID=1734049 RepID=A0A4R2TQ46_9FIRM|nr:translation initiation factor IF-2 [Serpentinicella alkaliphila]QUH26326.1 translation initiation factor IF-2 [Serpentinicella alkaliphila]TCQ05908.1 translation initiation factor 2 (bIF-2) [Serpentinicella alkaliphila]